MQGDINHINQHGSHPSGIGFVKKTMGLDHSVGLVNLMRTNMGMG